MCDKTMIKNKSIMVETLFYAAEYDISLFDNIRLKKKRFQKNKRKLSFKIKFTNVSL